MSGLKQQRVSQRTLFLTGTFLGLYFFFAYQPLSRRVDALNSPLTNVWYQLRGIELESGTVDPKDLSPIAENLRQVERSVALLESASQQVGQRLELDPTVRAKLREPFQLIDYQNERQLRIEELSRMAKEQKVLLEPAVTAGFPEHTADRQRPELLWTQLAIVHKLLSAAIACKVSNVKSLSIPPVEPHVSTLDGHEFLEEIPVRLELSGSMESVYRFLLCLPLRADELKTLELPESIPARPVLFIDRILLRRQAPEKSDEVSLELRVCGLVYGDQIANEAIE